MHLRWLVSVRVCCYIVTALADPYSIVLSFSALLSAGESARACVCAKVEKVRILVGVQHRLYIVIAIRSVPTQGCAVVSGETAYILYLPGDVTPGAWGPGLLINR